MESLQISLDPVLDAAPSEEDRDHLACCRDFLSDSPILALCGFAISDDMVAFSNHICEECVKIASDRLRELGVSESADGSMPRVCIRDGSPCPTGDEADALDRRIVGLD